MEILAALKQEEAKLQHQLTGIRSAIAALGGSYSGGGYGSGVAKRGGRGKRVVSAALRATWGAGAHAKDMSRVIHSPVKIPASHQYSPTPNPQSKNCSKT